MKIYIKNMVCDRCNLVVRELLNDMQLPYHTVTLGEVDLDCDVLEEAQRQQLSERLISLGFEMIDSRKAQLIEKIKLLVIDLVQMQDVPEKTRLSDFISKKLHQDYSHLSHLFSSVEGITLEQYFILQKIEKAKELLVYDELSTTEIAFKLGYSSVAHLSGQFKKITGMTPSQFKKSRNTQLRNPLDKVSAANESA